MISQAAWSDVDSVLMLWRQTWKEHAKRLPEAFGDAPVKSWEHKLRRGFRLRWRDNRFGYYSPHLLIARDDGDFVGHLLFRTGKGRSGKGALIEDVSVSSAHVRRGIASALLSEFRSICRAQDIVRVEAMIWRGNSASEAFFQGEGFAEQYTTYRKYVKD